MLLPSFICTSNSTPWPGTRTGRTMLWPMTSPASLRMITSRIGVCSVFSRHSQPNANVIRPTATITASQIRRYSGNRRPAFQAVMRRDASQSCCLANT